MPTFVLSAPLIVLAYQSVSLLGELLRRSRSGSRSRSELLRLLHGRT